MNSVEGIVQRKIKIKSSKRSLKSKEYIWWRDRKR